MLNNGTKGSGECGCGNASLLCTPYRNPTMDPSPFPARFEHHPPMMPTLDLNGRKPGASQSCHDGGARDNYLELLSASLGRKLESRAEMEHTRACCLSIYIYICICVYIYIYIKGLVVGIFERLSGTCLQYFWGRGICCQLRFC